MIDAKVTSSISGIMSFSMLPLDWDYSRTIVDVKKLDHGEFSRGHDGNLIVRKAEDSSYGCGGLFNLRHDDESVIFVVYLTWTGLLEGYIQDGNCQFELQRLSSDKMQIRYQNQIVVDIDKLPLKSK